MKKLIPLILAALPLVSHAEITTGFYVGGSLGYVTAEDEGTAYTQGIPTPNGWAQETSPDGGSIAILGGYNWKLNDKVLVGLEADYAFRSGGDRVYQERYGVVDTNYAAKTRLSEATSLRARVGYAATEKATVYLTAGYAAAKVKRSFYQFSPSETESHSTWQEGWTAGLGGDYALSKNVAVRVEYRYADYGDKKVKANLWTEVYKQELTEQTLHVGAVYNF